MGDAERLKPKNAKDAHISISTPNTRSRFDDRSSLTETCTGAPSGSKKSTDTPNLVRDARIALGGLVQNGSMSASESVDQLKLYADKIKKDPNLSEAEKKLAEHTLSWQMNELKKLATTQTERDYFDWLIKIAAESLPDGKKSDLYKKMAEANEESRKREELLKTEAFLTNQPIENIQIPQNTLESKPEQINFQPQTSPEPSTQQTIQTTSNQQSLSSVPDAIRYSDQQPSSQNGFISSVLYQIMQVADNQAQKFLGLVDLGLSAVAPDRLVIDSSNKKLVSEFPNQNQFQKIPPQPIESLSTRIDIPSVSIKSQDQIILPKPPHVRVLPVEISGIMTTTKPIEVPSRKPESNNLPLSDNRISSSPPAPLHMVGSGKRLFFLDKDDFQLEKPFSMPNKDKQSTPLQNSNPKKTTSIIKNRSRTKSRPTVSKSDFTIISKEQLKVLRSKKITNKRLLDLSKKEKIKKATVISKQKKTKENMSPKSIVQKRSTPNVASQKIRVVKSPSKFEFSSKRKQKSSSVLSKKPADQKNVKRTLKVDEKRISLSVEERKAKQKQKREKEKKALAEKIKLILLKKSKKQNSSKRR